MIIDELSIVIIGLNEELFLEKSINSAKKLIQKSSLEKSKNEIIYVDSGSFDRSLDIAKNSVDKLFLLTKDKSAAAARKVGEINSTFKFILFLDGDMEVDENFIKEVNKYILSKSYNEKNIGFIGRRDDLNYTNDGQKLISEIHNTYNSLSIKEVNHIGGALLINKKKLHEIGGYDPSQVRAEEPLLLIDLLQKDYSIIDISKPFIIHHNNKSFNIKKKVSLALLPKGGSYYYGMLCLKVIKRKYFKGFYKVFKFTSLTWFLDFFLLLSFLSSLFVIPTIILFFIIVKKKYKFLLTANLKIFGVFLFLFIKKEKFVFEYKELLGKIN